MGERLEVRSGIKPPIAPIQQPEARDLSVITSRFHQTSPAMPFETPDPCEGRVKGNLHLTLQVEIGSREQRQEFRHISRRVDSTDQLRPDLARVEVQRLRLLLTQPLPAVFSHVIGLLPRFAL